MKHLPTPVATFLFFLITMSGCSTGGRFKIPPGTNLEIYGRPVTVNENGVARTRPFFWSAAGGVPYRLIKDGQVIKQGKVPSRFRVSSIFFPPFAIIYWPMGMNGSVVNDLTQGLDVAAVPPTSDPAAKAEMFDSGMGQPVAVMIDSKDSSTGVQNKKIAETTRQSPCSIEQILSMKNMNLSEEQIKAACG